MTLRHKLSTVSLFKGSKKLTVMLSQSIETKCYRVIFSLMKINHI